MTIAEITRTARDLSLKRFSKKSGIVIALLDTSVYTRSLLAINCQFKPAPVARPLPNQHSEIPAAYMAPGRASNNQPLISDAPALSAATAGPNDLPQSTQSDKSVVRRYMSTPINNIPLLSTIKEI